MYRLLKVILLTCKNFVLRKEHGPYISFEFENRWEGMNLKIGGRALIGAWGLKVTNTVLQQHCHPLALLTIKVKDPESKCPS